MWQINFKQLCGLIVVILTFSVAIVLALIAIILSLPSTLLLWVVSKMEQGIHRIMSAIDFGTNISIPTTPSTPADDTVVAISKFWGRK